MNSELNNIDRLQKWYLSNCNGDWEHQYGIKVETIDNPGWSVKVELLETKLQEKKIKTIDKERSEYDWLYCVIEDYILKGYCGPENLNELLEIILDVLDA